jgi:hypothetical protein
MSTDEMQELLCLRDAASPHYTERWGMKLSPQKLLKLGCLFETYGLVDCAAELLVEHRGPLEELVDVQWCLDALSTELDPSCKSFSELNRRFEASPTSFYPGQSAR